MTAARYFIAAPTPRIYFRNFAIIFGFSIFNEIFAFQF